MIFFHKILQKFLQCANLGAEKGQKVRDKMFGGGNEWGGGGNEWGGGAPPGASRLGWRRPALRPSTPRLSSTSIKLKRWWNIEH